MKVVDESYMFSPRPARDHYAFWGRLDVRHLVKTRSAHIERTVTRVGDSMERITSRHCGVCENESASAW